MTPGVAPAGEDRAPLAVSLNEVKAYLRIETSDEDAVLAGLVRTATSLCEAFTGQVPIVETRAASIPADGCWHRLAPTPLRRVTGTGGLTMAGEAAAVSPEEVDLQIDFSGDGWARCRPASGAATAALTVEAGLSADWNGLPEAVRQGIMRLAAHLYTHRDADGERGPPAAIAALWRPWRRVRLS